MRKLGKLNFSLLCVIIVLSTLAYGTVHQPTIALFYLSVAAMAMIWAIRCLTKGELVVSRHVFQIPLVGALVYAIIQFIPIGSVAAVAGVSGIPRTLSLSPYDTATTAVQLAALTTFFFLALVSINRARRLERLLSFILIFGFIFAFFAILQSFLSPTRIYGIYERPTPFGSFVNRHNYAAYIEMAMALPLGMLMTGAVRRDRKLLYITAVVIMGISLLLSGSRGGLFAIIAAVILLVVMTTRSHGTKNVVLKVGLTVVMIGVVVAGAILIGGESSLSRMSETAKAGDITTDRTQIWAVTTKVIAANFPLGAGIGAFAQAYTPFDSFNGLARVEQAHNDYLQVAADAGIIGVVLLGLFIFWLVREGRRGINVKNTFRRGIAVGSLAGIFAVMVHSLFDFVLHTTAVTLLFLLLLAMLAASGRDFDDEITDYDEPEKGRKRSGGKVKAFR